jgi:hypothetical protein
LDEKLRSRPVPVLRVLCEDPGRAPDALVGVGHGGRGGALMLAASSWSRSLIVLASERLCTVGCSDILGGITAAPKAGEGSAPGRGPSLVPSDPTKIERLYDTKHANQSYRHSSRAIRRTSWAALLLREAEAGVVAFPLAFRLEEVDGVAGGLF